MKRRIRSVNPKDPIAHIKMLVKAKEVDRAYAFWRNLSVELRALSWKALLEEQSLKNIIRGDIQNHLGWTAGVRDLFTNPIHKGIAFKIAFKELHQV